MGLYENLCFFSLEENVVILIYRKVYFHLAKVPRHKIPLKILNFITLKLHVDVSASFRNGCYCWILCIEGSIYFFGYSLRGPRRTTESIMTKFGFVRSGRGEIFWRKTQRTETTAQLSELERQRLQVDPFVVTC